MHSIKTKINEANPHFKKLKPSISTPYKNQNNFITAIAKGRNKRLKYAIEIKIKPIISHSDLTCEPPIFISPRFLRHAEGIKSICF